MEAVGKKEFQIGPTTVDLRSRTFLMGIVNVTPDSFSDGGKHFDKELAIRRALELVEEGADFIDVGGESTRPGSDPVPAEEELRRVIPVLEGIARRTAVPLSIDTMKSEVAARATEAGAVIINDVSGLRSDPAIADVAARTRSTLVLMHMKGSPKTMQQDPVYDDVMREIVDELRAGIQTAEERGVDQVIVDPGIGFGKTMQHNFEILRRLRELEELDRPILVGPSRKSFIGKLLDLPVEERTEGTAASVAVAIMNGANILRVHDVKLMKRVARVVDEVRGH